MNQNSNQPPNPTPDQTPAKPKSKGGFASMDRVRQKEIASLGGKAAHAKGTAHEWTPAEAKAVGSLGGNATKTKRLSRDLQKVLDQIPE